MCTLKKILLWFFLILVFLITQGFFLIWLYEDEIKELAVKKLNEQLNTEVSVGHITFSVFEHFPYASIHFPEIAVREATKGSKSNLLKAEEISLLFNLLDLYKKNYRIIKMVVSDGELNLRIDQDGEGNYTIFTPSAVEGDSAFAINIETIDLRHVKVFFLNRQLNQEYSVVADQAVLSGAFSAEKYDMTIAGGLFVNTVRVDSIEYLRRQPVKVELKLHVDETRDSYRFKDGLLKFPDFSLAVKGSIQNQPETAFCDLDIEGREMEIQSFVALLPDEYAGYLKNYKSQGEFYLSVKIKGKIDAQHNPLIVAGAGIRNGELSIVHETLGERKFENVDMEVFHTNGTHQTDSTSLVEVRKVSGTLGGKPFSGKLSYKNFKEPYLNLSIDAEFDLADLLPFVNYEKIASASGNVRFNASFSGLLNDFKSTTTIQNTTAEGKVEVANGSLTVKNNPLEVKELNGNFDFRNNDLRIEKFSGKVSGSNFSLSGYFRNLVAFFLLPDQPLEMDVQLRSSLINLDELLVASAARPSDDTTYIFKINPKLVCNIRADVDLIKFQKFTATHLKGNVLVKDQVVRSEFLSFNSMDGLVFARLSIDASPEKHILVNADATIKSVNIHKLFDEFENFGQEVLTDRQINGKLSANVNFSSAWTKTLYADLPKLYAKATVLIENGELLSFEPLMALSKYVDVNDLKNLKFATLQNEIEIKDETIFIPQMEVRNNALNMTISGTHTFENFIDYRVKILLSELLAAKSKKIKKEEFGRIEDDGSGRVTLHLKMTGTAENPTIAIDRLGIREKVAGDVKQEGKEIKEVLRNEFDNWFKKDKTYKETLNENATEWEQDIPGQKAPMQQPLQSKQQEVDAKKSKLQKLKEKLSEPVEDE